MEMAGGEMPAHDWAQRRLLRAAAIETVRQRVLKRHPAGGLTGLGTSLLRMMRSRLAFGSGIGTAESSATMVGMHRRGEERAALS
jgi:hypothetical protein